MNDPSSFMRESGLAPTSRSNLTFYMASVCSHARPDPLEGSFVWDESIQEWCPGLVLESGMGLSAINGPCTTRRTPMTMAPNVQSRWRLPVCRVDDHPLERTCGGVAFLTSSATEILRPPPTPPPPLNPWPPALPASASDYWRTWHPTATEFPLDSNSDGEYEITCGIPSCGVNLPIFKGGIDTTVTLARELEVQGTFHQTLCPFECRPTSFKHQLSEAEYASLSTGSGFGGFIFRATKTP